MILYTIFPVYTRGFSYYLKSFHFRKKLFCGFWLQKAPSGGFFRQAPQGAFPASCRSSDFSKKHSLLNCYYFSIPQSTAICKSFLRVLQIVANCMSQDSVLTVFPMVIPIFPRVFPIVFQQFPAFSDGVLIFNFAKSPFSPEFSSFFVDFDLSAVYEEKFLAPKTGYSACITEKQPQSA